jgi:hypothetical protein
MFAQAIGGPLPSRGAAGLIQQFFDFRPVAGLFDGNLIHFELPDWRRVRKAAAWP